MRGRIPPIGHSMGFTGLFASALPTPPIAAWVTHEEVDVLRFEEIDGRAVRRRERRERLPPTVAAARGRLADVVAVAAASAARARGGGSPRAPSSASLRPEGAGAHRAGCAAGVATGAEDDGARRGRPVIPPGL